MSSKLISAAPAVSTRVSDSIAKHISRIAQSRIPAKPIRPRTAPPRPAPTRPLQTSRAPTATKTLAPSVRTLASSVPIVESAPLKSALKLPGTTVGPKKTVKFKYQRHNIAEVRFFEYNKPGVRRDPVGPGVNVAHIRGPATVKLISGTTCQVRPKEIFFEPSREGSHGSDGNEGRCPYCAYGQNRGGFIPAYHHRLGEKDDISEGDLDHSWWQGCFSLLCEEHDTSA